MTVKFKVPVKLFELGQIVATPAAIEATDSDFRMECLSRHIRGDWGSVCKEDWAENFDALIHGNRLLSAYPIHPDQPTEQHGHTNRLWIITEADRSVTTLLLPEEY